MTRPTTAAAWCSATRTSRGTARSASSSRSSRSRARSTSAARACSACRSINIGHTDHLAWSHTVSTAYRFTPFELKLVPGSPTTYLYDGQPRQMRADDVTVTVKNADGSLETRSRTLYSSHHGSVLTSILGLPLFPWTPATAWAMGDANAGNFRYLNHFFEVNQAQSVNELREIQERNQGVPWVNTLAADSDGRRVLRRHLGGPERDRTRRRRSATRSWDAAPTRRSACRCWTARCRRANGAPTPTRSSPASSARATCPSCSADDYVTNSNDSYWLSNPEQPLEGFDRIIGDERTERSLRTAVGPREVEQRLAGDRRLAGRPVHAAPAPGHRVRDRQYAGELWRDELAGFCEATPTMTGIERAGGRERGLPGAARLGPEGQPRQPRRDPVPALREPRAGRGTGGGHARPVHRRSSTSTTPCTRRTG